MVRVRIDDLRSGAGTRTGLPAGLVGGMDLAAAGMPVAAGRPPENLTRVTLSYPIARGSVKLLSGELSTVELVGRPTDTAPTGIHLLLGNGTSHCWVTIEDDPAGAGKTLALRGMPFSTQLVNYNAGLAVGLFLLMNHESYARFPEAVSNAVSAWTGTDEDATTRALARMADEMSYTLEMMLDGRDPLGIQAVIMDREPPVECSQVFEGGEALKAAFTDAGAFARYTGTTTPERKAQMVTPDELVVPGFVGDLPRKLADSIRRGRHVLMTGPTGTGKTWCAREVTSRLGCPTSYVGGSEGLEDRDIIGSVSIVNGDTRFVDGPLVESLRSGTRQAEKWEVERAAAAAQGREPLPVAPAVLIVDEISRLQSRHQNVFVSAMNVRPVTMDYYLRVPDTNEEVCCPVGFWLVIAARNFGSSYVGTNTMDLALERRFHRKLEVEYLPAEAEIELLRSRTGLDEILAKVLVKVAQDTRFQLSQLRAPIDTDTLIKWAEELAHIQTQGPAVDEQVLLATARDVVFDIVLERTERGGFDPAGEAVLTDNTSENWNDAVQP